MSNQNASMRILIVKRDKLGDLLLTTPMLSWLRQSLPDAEIHVLANDYNAWVLEGNPNINRTWVTPRIRHSGKLRLGAVVHTIWQFIQLRRQKFDWVLAGNGDDSPRATRKALEVKGRHTVAYCAHPEKWPKLTHAVRPPVQEHESRRLAKLAEAIGLKVPDALPPPYFKLPASGHTFANAWLAERGLTTGQYFVLGLGARRAKKQPTCAQILDWSAAIFERYGLPTVFMWTPGQSGDPQYPGDDETAEPILAAGRSYIYPFRGPLPEALGLIWHARTSLFPDSGLMHFAAASPGGVLGLFAETDVSPSPSQWGPLGPRAHWLEARYTVSELDNERVLSEIVELISISEFAV